MSSKFAISAIVHVFTDEFGPTFEIMEMNKIVVSSIYFDEVADHIDYMLDAVIEDKTKERLISVVIFGELIYTTDYFGEVDSDTSLKASSVEDFTEEAEKEYWIEFEKSCEKLKNDKTI